MGCRHERLECTNNVLRCAICGAVLPLAMLGTTPSVSAEGAATFPEGEGFGGDEGAATFPEGEGFEVAEVPADEPTRRIGFESHKEPAKPRRSRKGK